VDNTKKSPRVISFCSGIRGIERGIEQVIGPLRIVAHVEIEAIIIENMVCEMEAGAVAPAPIWTNARTFPSHLFRGCVDWIVGGYPCQGESLAGKRELENYAGYLWPAIRESIRTIKPMGCFFENVDDHLTGTFKYVLDDLHQMGYSVEAGVFSAEEVGAPHERQRIFILAVHNSSRHRFSEVTSKMGDSNNQQINSSKRRIWTEFNPTSKVVNSSKQRLSVSRFEWIRQHGKEKITGMDRGLEQSSSEFGNTNNPGLEGRNGPVCKKCTTQWTTRENGPFSRVRKWPATAGQNQFKWEHPRTISREAESTVGLSANGFRFREDFLRALGNACVPDQAELAFRTLVQKF